jgi:hypothetical protein
MELNKKYLDKSVQSVNAMKLFSHNYYLSQDEVCNAAVTPILEALEGSLSTCLNFDGSKCDLWYLESHTGCLQLMQILNELTGYPIWDNNPSQLKLNMDEL